MHCLHLNYTIRLLILSFAHDLYLKVVFFEVNIHFLHFTRVVKVTRQKMISRISTTLFPILIILVNLHENAGKELFR